MVPAAVPQRAKAAQRFDSNCLQGEILDYEIVGAKAENLRGYSSTYLPLDRSASVVVGPNNAGKTSILRLLNWLINDVDPEQCRSEWRLPEEISAFLLPARETMHRARRLVLRVRIADGRMHRKYRCVDGIATLRLNIRLSPSPVAYLALGEARRGEQKQSSGYALELLRRVQDSVNLIYVPSFRDVASTRFKSTLREAFLQRVSSRVLHHQQGGAPGEYRTVKRSVDAITKTLEKLASPVWQEMSANLPPGLARAGSITVGFEVEALIGFLAEKFALRVSTGDHDSSQVPLSELGSGLQSLLDLAVSRSEASKSSATSILVVEEPESFLHPSAQRVITRSLLTQGVAKVVLTTHSSIVVDESSFNQVVICKDHKFYFPNDVDTAREEINSAFLTGHGSEMLFARSVLFVEGESDRLFFELIRRRLASIDDTGRMDQMYVVSVGGKAGFAPWIRILESYGSPADRPISWFVCADGDAASEVRRAFQEAKITVSQSVLDRLAEVGAAMGRGVEAWARAIKVLNKETHAAGISFGLAPVDLEHAALSSAATPTLRQLQGVIGAAQPSLQAVLDKLGSKAFAPNAEPIKSPWVRGHIAKTIPSPEISEDIKHLMGRWMQPLFTQAQINSMLSRLPS